MELWSAIVNALSSTGADNLLTAVGIYVATPLVVHINIQYLKYDRRERQLPELGRWTVRGIAFCVCVVLALFIGWRIGRWPFDQAFDHAVNVGIMYPLAMWAYMAYLKKNYPEAARKLTAPRRRTHEGKDPDDTSTTWGGEL